MSDQTAPPHKRRLAWMPWLWDRLKPHQRRWAIPWQETVQAAATQFEDVQLGRDGMLAPDAVLIAEPGRRVVFGDRFRIATGVFVHGAVRAGNDVSLNPRVTLDGGRAGIELGDGCRIAQDASLYAWNHGLARDRPIREQPVTSEGIRLGRDVWVGTRAVIVDGVAIGDGAVIGAGAVVTRDIAPYTIVAGNPARPVGSRT